MSSRIEIIVFYVGFGDCIHITLPDNKQLLIDTGHKKHARRIIDRLKSMGKSIDYLLITQ